MYLLIRRKADILIACDLDTLPANYLVSLLRNCKLVYDSHEYFTEVPELQNRTFVRNVWLSIEKYIVPRLKHAYTVSHSIANEYEAKYGVKFEVIRNLSLKKKTAEKYPLPENLREKKKIIYQGAVNTGRGIEIVMEAVKLLDDVVFIIAGEGDLYPALRKQAEEEELGDKVLFTGRIPHERLSGLTAHADIGISFEQDMGKNYRFALPNKLFDYFQAGVPVLVSGLPEMKAIVEEYKTGLVVDSSDPAVLKEKIIYMLYNEKARKNWKANLAIAADELCWEKEEMKLKNIFKKAGLTFYDQGC